MLVDGSWFYAKKNVDNDPKILCQQSTLLVKLYSDNIIPAAIEDQALTAVNSCPNQRPALMSTKSQRLVV